MSGVSHKHVPPPLLKTASAWTSVVLLSWCATSRRFVDVRPLTGSADACLPCRSAGASGWPRHPGKSSVILDTERRLTGCVLAGGRAPQCEQRFYKEGADEQVRRRQVCPVREAPDHARQVPQELARQAHPGREDPLRSLGRPDREDHSRQDLPQSAPRPRGDAGAFALFYPDLQRDSPFRMPLPRWLCCSS